MYKHIILAYDGSGSGQKALLNSRNWRTGASPD